MSDKKETWLVVPGFTSYEVSDLGRVRRADSKQRLKTTPRVNGYLQVTLCNNGKMKNFTVHRLVARAFLPRVPDKDLVLHINGDKSDNRLENLYRGTFAENAQDAIRHGTFGRGSNNNRAKLSEDDVRTIRFNLLRGVRQTDLARQYNVSKSLINKIHLKKRWNHLEGE